MKRNFLDAERMDLSTDSGVENERHISVRRQSNAADRRFKRDPGRFGRPRISDHDRFVGDLGLGGP